MNVAVWFLLVNVALCLYSPSLPEYGGRGRGCVRQGVECVNLPVRVPPGGSAGLRLGDLSCVSGLFGETDPVLTRGLSFFAIVQTAESPPSEIWPRPKPAVSRPDLISYQIASPLSSTYSRS